MSNKKFKDNPIIKGLIKFGNAQIAGDSGAGTSVAIASGYEYDPKEGWVQKNFNDLDVKQLRDNLAIEGLGVMGEMVGLPLIGIKIFPKIIRLGNPEQYLKYHLKRLNRNMPEVYSPEEYAKTYYKKFYNDRSGISEEDFIKQLTEKLKGEALAIDDVVVMDDNVITKFTNNNLSNNAKKDLIISHEIDHVLNPIKPTDMKPLGFDFNLIKDPTIRNYLKSRKSGELRARGSQLKDYFGKTKKRSSLSKEELEYAKENYIKDVGFNNEMTEFFDGITNYEQFAKWLSKYSSAFIPFGLYKSNNN